MFFYHTFLQRLYLFLKYGIPNVPSIDFNTKVYIPSLIILGIPGQTTFTSLGVIHFIDVVSQIIEVIRQL